MRDSRVHAGVDGADLLEEVSAVVLKAYLGGAGRAKSFVFGTAVAGGFKNKIEGLCAEIGEGGGFENIDGDGPVDANDDKLDAVAWVPFVDGQPGKLVLFAQCKTGSNWEDQITQLQPDAFLKRWTKHRGFLVDPVRVFCISEAARLAKWKGTLLYAGLLFERCRLVDFSNGIEGALLERIRAWSAAAVETVAIG
jgi:hypothetical protein